MPATVINMSIKYIWLTKDGKGIFLVYNPRSRRIIKQWSAFTNGDVLFVHQSIDTIMLKLLKQHWEIIDEGEYE